MNEYRRNGLIFDVRDEGRRDGPVVLLLHGFPQTSACWRHVLPGLLAAGFRTLAPDQRGYSPRARPTSRRAYAMDELVADVVALADVSGTDRVHLVGHDWGAAVAWTVAARHPDRLHTLSALSVPHPHAMKRAMLSGKQALRSWYVGFFQLPSIPEALLGRGLRRALIRTGLDAPTAARYAAHMRDPGALTGALNWYRAIRPPSPREPSRVVTPTLLLWGSADTAIGRKAILAAAQYVDGPYRLEILDGATHWLPEQEPQWVTRLLLEHLARGG